VKKILITKEPCQTRVAIISKDKLQDLYFDTESKEDLENCFFKGRVSKILPGIQTAFVDIGKDKAGFLHISEIDRALATEKIVEFLQEKDDTRIEFTAREIKTSMDIGKIFSEEEDILVQVIKEPINDKGAKLTTCFTLPGKFIVLMPNIPQIGVSKKIEDKNERIRLKNVLAKSLPQGMGAIVRTTTDSCSEASIKKDIAFLVSVWKSILKKQKRAVYGEKVYQDLPLPLRAVRDHLDSDVEFVLVDDVQTKNLVCSFVKNYTPKDVGKIRLYDEIQFLFDRFDIDKQIEKSLQKKVLLRSGGTVVIESTEAMTVIDVNTGKFAGTGSMEDTILKTNLEAADEIVTQLRLRNIGGLIVIDFIDMSNQSNRQKLSRFLEKTLKERDKFQSVTLRVSEFGIVQMTRKRSGKTLTQQLTNPCPACYGNGRVESISTKAFYILRKATEEIKRLNLSGTVVLVVSNKAFDYIIHNEYKAILSMEKILKCKIILECMKSFDDKKFEVSLSA
jgi:ribonuclease G